MIRSAVSFQLTKAVRSVLDNLHLSQLVDVAVLALHAAVGEASLDLERAIGRFIAVRVRAVLVLTAEAKQSG